MSAKSIQKSIDKAYKKVGKTIGYVYSVYRANNNIDVLDLSNLIGTAKFTVTLNTEYNKAVDKSTPPIWTAYTDNSIIQEGDFVYSEEHNRTFFIMSKKDHLPTLAVEVPDRIDIRKVAYQDIGNGYEPTNTDYLVRNLPAFLTYGAVNQSGLMGGRVEVSGVRTLEVYTNVPKAFSLMGQSMMDYLDFKGNILSYDYPFLGAGTKITARESGAQ